MAMEIPQDLRYAKTHEWVRLDSDGLVTVGITAHAQDALGDVTYVELPSAGQTFGREDDFGVVESTKTTSDLYMPVAGEIVRTNKRLEDEPELINADSYGQGWMLQVRLLEVAQFEELMSAEEYGRFLHS